MQCPQAHLGLGEVPLIGHSCLPHRSYLSQDGKHQAASSQSLNQWRLLLGERGGSGRRKSDLKVQRQRKEGRCRVTWRIFHAAVTSAPTSVGGCQALAGVKNCTA